MSRQVQTSNEASLHRAIATLQRLADLFTERREQLAREAALSVPQWRVLEEIATEHFMPSLFARRRSVSAAAVSKLIRGLLDEQLIRVRVSEQDGRQRDYTLTARGKKSLERLRASRERAIGAVWGDLSAQELDQFARFGSELGDRLEDYAATGGD
jgi:DNA-binding MarR family transcriptional regulator